MKKHTEKIALYLHNEYGISPNMLSYSRIFSAPWLALGAMSILKNESTFLLILFLILYFIAVLTDYMDGVLARYLQKTGEHNVFFGGRLDRIADKIFIIFLLIPFGSNLFTILIILGESLLAYHSLVAVGPETQAKKIGKIKMVLQITLIPFLLIYSTTSFIPAMFLYSYLTLTVIFTFMSAYHHFFKYKNVGQD
ncbi:MAG: CDP-alcohol phosphatidyltransferase family protein [Candidatus Pacebacteria bacterium]|nr:CDP-alcohol phosphatidyltransferase family protein [Candidatus Paceibacterota bacterium]MCF7862762.1 CDP-alcohol phosphatidyltransferase family protein [Candidatus Paceibacterota bacterium]